LGSHAAQKPGQCALPAARDSLVFRAPDQDRRFPCWKISASFVSHFSVFLLWSWKILLVPFFEKKSEGELKKFLGSVWD
jgi:hypothetical protein